jgi:hypothetical protein
MSTQQPPASPQPPYGQQPPQGYFPPQPPPKKKHTLRNVLLIIITLCVLFIAGCAALVGMAANEVGKEINEATEADSQPGGPDNPLTIQEGKAFQVAGFKYAAGWSIKKDAFGFWEVKGLKVTNERDERDSAIVEIKLWKGSEVLSSASCSTDQIAPKTTVTLSCLSGDKLPKKYSKMTINDTF